MPDLDAFMRRLLDGFGDKLVAKLGEDRAVELAEKEPERLQALIDDAVMGIIATSGQGLVEQLKQDGPAMLAHRRAERRGFEERLTRQWARAFALAEMAMVVASEAGDTFNEKHRPQAIDDNDLVFEVLTRLHARACRIAEEVLTLLKSGFGQAALARWRSLHEVAVVAWFIEEHGQDTAERYLLHEHIESWRAMDEMQVSADRLDLEPFTEEELRDAQAIKDDLTARYGQAYAASYG